MSRSLLALVAAVAILSACATGPTVEELQAFNNAACDTAGFEAGTDAHRLCLLLQDNNRRLEAVERRLNFIELDVRSGFGWGGRCIDRRC